MYQKYIRIVMEDILEYLNTQNFPGYLTNKYIREIASIVAPFDPLGVGDLFKQRVFVDLFIPFRLLLNAKLDHNFEYHRITQKFRIPAEDYVDLPYVNTDQKYKYRIHVSAPKNNTRKLPVVVDFHTGGWTSFSPSKMLLSSKNYIETWKDTPYILIEIGFPLAPEFQWPIQNEAGYHAVVEWISENSCKYNLDTTKIVVSGESSGGHIAASVTKMWLQRGSPKVKIVGQILGAPVITPNFDSFSWKAYRYMPSSVDNYAHGGYRIWDQYLYNEEDINHKNLNVLTGDYQYPQTLIATSTKDVYKNGAIDYHLFLLQNQSHVVMKRYLNKSHGSINTGYNDKDSRNWKKTHDAFLKSAFKLQNYQDKHPIKYEYRGLDYFNWPITGASMDNWNIDISSLIH